LPIPERKKSLRAEPPAARMVEDIVGCKWSLAVLERVRSGVSRPGALEHSLPGLSTKVLNERLRKLQRYGIVSRTAYPEVPPRVEYALTPFGRKFVQVLDGVAALERELAQEPEAADT
jgi:DNA-binding HxlR family transcriptional regulator